MLSGALAVACLCIVVWPASAHPGGVDKKGCHTERHTSERHCHSERLRARELSSCDLETPPRANDEGVFHGPLVRVYDGDTFEAKVQGVVMEFRLAEADAPERDQHYGDNARRELLELLQGRELVLAPVDTDRYGRTVVFVWNGAVCVNKELVRRGAAWFYDEFATTNALQLVEDEARDAKRGLWRLPLRNRMEPWVWRKEAR